MMRLVFLVLLVPAVAFADATTPDKGGKAPAAPEWIEYARAGEAVEATPYAVGTRLFLMADGTPVTVKSANERSYEVADAAGRKRTVPYHALTPFAFDVGGVPVRVGFDEQFKIVVRARTTLTLESAGRGYLYDDGGIVDARLVADAAPVPLVRVGSHPQACSNYWDAYVSVVDGVPRVALQLDGVADPPAHATPDVKFDRAAGTALVTLSVSEDEEGERVKKTRTRYRWSGSVFEKANRSKRAQGISK